MPQKKRTEIGKIEMTISTGDVAGFLSLHVKETKRYFWYI
jgi:hypothetical protein